MRGSSQAGHGHLDLRQRRIYSVPTVRSMINTVVLMQAGVNDQYVASFVSNTYYVVLGLDHYCIEICFADERVVIA